MPVDGALRMWWNPSDDSGVPPRRWGASDRRRRLLINRLQTRFVIVQLCWTAVILVIFAALVFGPTAYDLFAGSRHQQQQAAGLFLDLHARLWPALVALASALAALIVMQAHRIVGPLVRFKAVFEAVGRGELWVPSKIRGGDFPQEESRALDAMLVSLRQRIGEVQREATSAGAALDRMPSAAASGVRAALSRLQASLKCFEVDRPSETPTLSESPFPTDAGFTLIEVLLVTSVIGLLAAIAVPGYEAALEKARVTRAIGDIRALQSELQSHGVANGCYPATLAAIGYGSMRDPWGSAYVYGVLEGAPGGGKGKGGGGGGGGACAACSGACLGRGQARKDRNLVPINSDFDFYSMGRDRQSVGPLTAKASRTTSSGPATVDSSASAGTTRRMSAWLRHPLDSRVGRRIALAAVVSALAPLLLFGSVVFARARAQLEAQDWQRLHHDTKTAALNGLVRLKLLEEELRWVATLTAVRPYGGPRPVPPGIGRMEALSVDPRPGPPANFAEGGRDAAGDDERSAAPSSGHRRAVDTWSGWRLGLDDRRTRRPECRRPRACPRPASSALATPRRCSRKTFCACGTPRLTSSVPTATPAPSLR